MRIYTHLYAYIRIYTHIYAYIRIYAWFEALELDLKLEVSIWSSRAEFEWNIGATLQPNAKFRKRLIDVLQKMHRELANTVFYGGEFENHANGCRVIRKMTENQWIWSDFSLEYWCCSAAVCKIPEMFNRCIARNASEAINQCFLA